VWNHNPKEDNLYDIVYVPIGVETLKYALNLKNKGKIKKLIVGPNISIPLSKDDIFFDARIDVIVVPSQWLQEYFYSLLGQRDARIIIIPAGVDIAEAHQSS
jgi:ribosome biogenesis protein Tsr3